MKQKRIDIEVMQSATTLHKYVQEDCQKAVCSFCSKALPLKDYFQCKHLSCSQCYLQILDNSLKYGRKVSCPKNCSISFKSKMDESNEGKKTEDLRSTNESLTKKLSKICPYCVSRPENVSQICDEQGAHKFCVACGRKLCNRCGMRSHEGQCHLNLNGVLLQETKLNYEQGKKPKAFQKESEYLQGHKCEQIKRKQIQQRPDKEQKDEGSDNKTDFIKQRMDQILKQKKQKKIIFIQLYQHLIEKRRKNIGFLIFLVPLLLIGQLILVFYASLFILFNTIAGWLLFIPIIEAHYLYLCIFCPISRSKYCSSCLTFLKVVLGYILPIPILLISYYLHLIIGGTIFWSKGYLLDMEQILSGGLPFWMRLRRMYIQNGHFYPPLCDCTLLENKNCKICDNFKVRNEIKGNYTLFLGVKNFILYRFCCYLSR